MADKEEITRKEIKATNALKKVMAEHFYELDEASKTGSKKIAWCTSVGPAELLRGMGFLVYYPENHGAMLGASRLAADLIPYANAVGYSPEICSYLTSDIGSFLQKKTPLSKVYNIETVPKPDVLVFNTNQCRDVQDWFSWYSREFKVPLVGVHGYRGVSEIKDYHLRSITTQIEGLVPTLEEVSGERFDMDKFKEAVGLSRRTSELWRACLETASAVPSPWTFFDATIHMGPAVVGRGTKQANEYYEILLPELQARIKNSLGAVDGEKHRLYWEGMPIWGKLRDLSEQFAALGSCVVASTYCNSWIFDQLDPNEPFESMAVAYTELFIVRDESYKEQYIKDCQEFFELDGIIFHDAKT